MFVEYDTEVGAFYVRIADGAHGRTAEISDFVMVDVAADGAVLGLELLCSPDAVTADERALLAERYPAAAAALVEVERLTRLSA